MRPVHAIVVASVMALVVAGCGLSSVVVDDGGPPVPPGRLGPIVQPDGGGPPVECRGVPLEDCKGFGNMDGAGDVVRYIVTCTSVCTPQKGDVRIDALRSNGRTEQLGQGSWAGAEAAPDVPPVPGASPPGPS
jgi:hypothetical protein